MRESDKPVLYGTVAPGMLYDATRDHVMMDKFLWGEDYMVMRNSSIESSDSEWKVQHNVIDRHKLLDLNGRISLSVLLGLVKVTGTVWYVGVVGLYCTMPGWCFTKQSLFSAQACTSMT